MSPEAAWKATLGELELQMNKSTFNTWLKDTHLVSAESDKYIVGVRTAYARDWLENRFYDTVSRTLNSVVETKPALEFVISTNHNTYQNGNGRINGSHQPNGLDRNAPEPAKITNSTNQTKKKKAQNAQMARTNLNTKYKFTSFVVGHNNRLAHAAALSVAERPGQTYNPLFIYGGVGLGKTHLLHAVGQKCIDRGLTVVYVSSETFTNDLIQSIRAQKMAQFREKYRTPDVLLIDDIQFVAGKESTQEELFHTFNDLHSQGKQVVLSSDRPPRAMVTLEERLKSRFEWGLMADIQLPDHETRMAILENKAEELGAQVPAIAFQTIAHHVRNNIRELEGALNKVVAYANLYDRPISEETVNMALADILRQPEKVTISRVISTVSDYYNVPNENMAGRGRSRAIAYPRQIAMYLCRTETDASFPQIGAHLGKRDHTTIMHGYEKIASRIESDSNLRRDILEIKAVLYESAS